MELELDVVAGGEADEVEPMIAGGAGDAAMPVGQLDPVGAVLEVLDHRALSPDLVGVHGRNLERRTWNLEVLSSTLLALIPVPN